MSIPYTTCPMEVSCDIATICVEMIISIRTYIFSESVYLNAISDPLRALSEAQCGDTLLELRC